MKTKGVACFVLGWLVPGLGHLFQKKFARGLTFLISIAAMAALGISMGGKIYPFQTENPLTILAFFADLGNGLLYALSRFLLFGAGELKNATFEFGTAFIAGAGLLNYLVALDAYDVAVGKKK
jgi:hypothetical protein